MKDYEEADKPHGFSFEASVVITTHLLCWRYWMNQTQINPSSFLWSLISQLFKIFLTSSPEVKRNFEQNILKNEFTWMGALVKFCSSFQKKGFSHEKDTEIDGEEMPAYSIFVSEVKNQNGISPVHFS